MTRKTDRITQTIASLFLVLSAACSATLSWDEEVAEPTFLAGQGTPGEFSAFKNGDPLLVHTGVQAGVWLMPVLRFQGLVGEPEISCIAVDLDKDQIIAENAGHLQSDEREGWHHLLYNMQVILPGHEPTDREALQEYEGDRILFSCDSIDSAGLRLSLSHEMTLSSP